MASPSTPTPQLFAILKEVYSELQAVSFPPLYGSGPQVVFGDFNVEQPFQNPERIHLIHRVRDGDQEWTQNRTKQETVTFEIDVVTAWAGQTGEQVLDRLEDLVTPIYQLWHATTGFTAPASGLGSHIYNLGGVESIAVNVFPSDDGNGYQGVATLTCSTVARIGMT